MRIAQRKREVIANYYAYLLKVNNRKLTAKQNKYFFDCINKIYRENDKIIYRGDKKDSLLKIYGIEKRGFPKEFNKSLFVMGPKGRMFLTKESPGIREIDIATATENEFSLIFRMLKSLLSREFPFSATRMAMKSFRDNENGLTMFFRNPENEQSFIDRMNSLPEKERIILRDYYLALLHHLDKSEYYSSSFLLSTTSSFEEAHKFSWKDENENSDNPMVFFGWVPKGYEGLLSAPNATILKREVDMNEIKLPIYERSFFPQQHEVTLKGGLLPYYLLGYLHKSIGKEVFEINPALFETDETWDGIELPVDQSSFYERMQNTMFARYFTVGENNLYRQHRRLY